MTGPGALSDLYKVTFSGTLGTDEQFAYSRWTTSATPDDQESVIDNYLGDVADMLATTVAAGPVATLENAFPDWVAWTQIKVAPWDTTTDKLKAGQTPAYRTISENGNGTTSSGMPYQVALAMTTRSAAPGRRKYNRFYLPPLVAQASVGKGLLDPDVADAFVLWLHLNITSHSAAGDNIVNYNPHYAGATHPIVDIYLGRRLDIIRRRANKEAEPRVVDAL
jgi:hypothetical protein